MKKYDKRDYPVGEVRTFLEPGPIVLVSSAWKGERNIMTMGWHMMAGFSSICCYISTGNHSHHLIRNSKECVINVPDVAIATKVVDVGNSSGSHTDKFAEFGLTAVPGEEVGAPLIAECHSSFECRMVESGVAGDSSMFLFDVVKAHVARAPKYPRTIHYRGNRIFMISGENTSKWSKRFRPGML